MATILIEAPGRTPWVVKLVRPITTVGSSPEADVQVDQAGLEPAHVQIVREGAQFVLVALLRDLTVNGRRERRRVLKDHDTARFGEISFEFFERDEDAPQPRASSLRALPVPGAPAGVTVELVSAFRHVHEFAIRLLANDSTETLVESILDSVIELTGADKGFLILLDAGGQPVVRAARNIDRQRVQLSLGGLSDSILRKVIESRAPLVIADALQDREFNASESIVAQNVLSVMCCPILDRDELRGVLYVGNNQATDVFDSASLDVMTIFAAQASLLLSHTQRIEDLVRVNKALETELKADRLGRLIGSSDSMQAIGRRIRKVATTDVPVLITGETGTGKEVAAKELHACSRRKSGPFVVVNCGAIPENLLESELFGHVKGAFTGAVMNKEGRFQAANGGTLFLDEIGELPVNLQVKLLRALQEHKVTPVGDGREVPVDIRILAATNRVLEEEIAEGRFREDLYYRLNVVSIELPPLRERGGDVELLAKYFLSEACKEHGRLVSGFSKPCLDAMRRYRWPGNVRQLQNRIQKAVVLADGPLLTPDDLELRPDDADEILSLAEAKERFSRQYIERVLEMNGGNRTKTARDLEVDPRTIFRHIERRDRGAVGAPLDGDAD
ncbi:MAG: sigma-54-dependent Fis family transcriptional regulator [Deltaproteobacteria bacterium]|nr:sigma-54-dependent Fis family transcriptional regulator [Deltaproteobacteria bacterium]